MSQWDRIYIYLIVERINSYTKPDTHFNTYQTNKKERKESSKLFKNVSTFLCIFCKRNYFKDLPWRENDLFFLFAFFFLTWIEWTFQLGIKLNVSF